MLDINDDDIFDKQESISNENELLHVAKNLLNGDILAYCKLKMYFICRFPLVPKLFKDKHIQIVFDLMKENADTYQNPFAQAMIGWMIWSGTGSTINLDLAIDYITKSAIQNNPVGLIEKGFIQWINAKNEDEVHLTYKFFVKALKLSSTNGYALHAMGLY